MTEHSLQLSFWRWFFRGTGGKPGYRRLVNKWLFFHGVVGVILAAIVAVPLNTAANSVLLPLVGILIGLCFAWAGNAQALLQAEELQEMTSHHAGGFSEYVFTFQAAIFAILVTLVAWALAGFEIFDTRWPTAKQATAYLLTEATLFTLSSLALRECWHVVLGSQSMLLSQFQIKQKRRGSAPQRAGNRGESVLGSEGVHER